MAAPFLEKIMRGWIRLALWAVGLWFFFAILTPAIEPLIPAWHKYNQLQEAQGHDSGALYYTNVPFTQDAETITRQAVEDGMRERAKARKNKD